MSKSQGSRDQLFVLIGPNKGETMTVNGHEFIDGECVVNVNADQLKSLSAVFRRYAAFTPEQAKEAEAEIKAKLSAEAKLPKAVVVGSVDLKPDEGKPGEPVPTLAEAVAALDPGNNDHWTSSGLPAMSAIETFMGSKAVSRSDVDAHFDGYTRDKAKALRG